MRHPLDQIPLHMRNRVFTAVLMLTLAIEAVFLATGGPLRTAAAPAGIISFEFTGSAASAAAMVAAWSPAARGMVGFNLGLDYLFLMAYSTAIAIGVLWAAGRLGPLGRIGGWVAWGQCTAALLDAIENAALLRLLTGPVADPWPQIAYWAAAVKFGLVALGLLYASAGAVAGWVRPAARPGVPS